MVYYKELQARIKKEVRFNKEELINILILILVTGFIFSFRDWGEETFDLAMGLKNLAACFLVAGITFFFRFYCQKTYGIIEAHKATFKIWWTGLIIALVITFLTNGIVPLVLAGCMSVVLMPRYRLGEFRFGFSYQINGMIAYWGIIGNLILALFSAIGLYLFPDNYFFGVGVKLNLIMAACSLIPIPQLEGLNIFFGSRFFYVMAILMVALTAVLLLTHTFAGLMVCAVLGSLYGIVYMLIGSEK